MNKLKIMTVIGTRPEIIRLSEVIKKLDSMDSVDHILVHTGQNYDYELNQIFFEDLELRQPNYYLDAAGDSVSITVGNILIKLDPIIEREKPDKFLVLGDTNSALSAIAAKKRGIPVYHCEAGNRSFDERVPEELNRKLVDHISDVNLAYSSIARGYLISEGIAPKRLIVSGSPMREILVKQANRVSESKVLEKLNLKNMKYIVASLHRDENVSNEDSLKKLAKSLNLIENKYKLKIIVSLHPRTKKELEKNDIALSESIILCPPLSFSDYINLQLNAFVVLSDSGTISEEAAILNLRAVNIRNSQERPEAYNHAVVPLSGLEFDDIIRSIEFVTSRVSITSIPIDYMEEDFSDRVLSSLLSVV